jgi:hypothetical protein
MMLGAVLEKIHLHGRFIAEGHHRHIWVLWVDGEEGHVLRMRRLKKDGTIYLRETVNGIPVALDFDLRQNWAKGSARKFLRGYRFRRSAHSGGRP